MSRKVKAAVLTAPNKLETTEFPYPSLKRGGAIVKTELSGICGTDKHTFRGEVKQYAGTPAEMSTPFPIIQGHENVGIIEEIDEDGSNNLEFSGQKLRVGDRVSMYPDVACGHCWYCKHIHGYPICDNIRSYGNSFSCASEPYLFGGWSQYIYIIPGVKLYKVPEGLSPEYAVFVELLAVASSLDKAKEFYSFGGEGFGFGDTVVIQGVGPIGMMHLIKARMLGADKIIVIDKSEFRLKMAKEFGADVAISLNNTTQKERLKIIHNETEGRGGDVVVECAGVPEAIPEGIELIRTGGVYLVVGNFVDCGKIGINTHKLCSKNIRLIGLSNHPVTMYGNSMRMMKRYEETFRFDKLISHRYSIEDAQKAMMKSMEPDSMKVVIDPWK